MIRTFQDLNVWEKGHSLVLEIYKTTKLFPREEQFGLTAQVRRSAI
ncbi:MAG: four helix bundle protein, partial [Candidatus Omnitrophica bacterium]|nr:four helix bundle protein [Candidatus Omnitrophota bacterium]